MENEYYDKIVYKKNAFLQMQEDLHKYYLGKKALIITTKSLINCHFTEIMNYTSSAGLTFETFVAKNNFSESELKNLSELLTQQNFDIYIVYGGGRACDVAKYFSNIFCVPFFMCPSACSTFAYFNNICINPYNSTRSFVCDGAERIYISESAIKKTPRNLVKQGVLTIVGCMEMLCMATIEGILFDRHAQIDDVLKGVLKLRKELSSIMSGDSDSKLVLMDILIDVGYGLNNVDLFKTSSYNLFLIMQKMFYSNNQIVGSGECFMLSSKVLLECYKNLFMQKKIKQFELPNLVKVAKNVEKSSVFCKKTNNYAYFCNILAQNEVIVRLNNLKEEFLFQTNKSLDVIKEMLACIKRYDNIFAYDVPSIKDVLFSVGLLPFVCENNYLVSLMAGIGMLNSF